MTTTENKAQTLYKKVGNRYVPVAEHFTADHWHEGTYIVRIEPGCKSMTRMVWRALDDKIEAVLNALQEGISSAIVRAQAEPTTGVISTDRELRGKVADLIFKETKGKVTRVTFPSIHDSVAAGLEYVRAYFGYLDKVEKAKHDLYRGVRKQRTR